VRSALVCSKAASAWWRFLRTVHWTGTLRKNRSIAAPLKTKLRTATGVVVFCRVRLSGVRVTGPLHRETHYFGSPVFIA
jgi:hypothetical protein